MGQLDTYQGSCKSLTHAPKSDVQNNVDVSKAKKQFHINGARKPPPQRWAHDDL